jgi:WD40 repeat protein
MIEEDGQIENDLPVNFREIFLKAENKEYTGHKKRVYTVDWNFNGTKLASGSVDFSIRVDKFIFIF